MSVRCRLCGKEQPEETVSVCHEALRHLLAAERGECCPACGRNHLACVRFE